MSQNKYTHIQSPKDLDYISKTYGIVKSQGNAVKDIFVKRFKIPLNNDFSKHPVYLYGLKEDLIVRLGLGSSER